MITIDESEYLRLKEKAGEIQTPADPCPPGRHAWKSEGGANAGCHPDCCCSVPVLTCINCGFCDYGDNEYAKDIVGACAAREELEHMDAQEGSA